MTKPVFKTLSLFAVVFALAATSRAHEEDYPSKGAAPSEDFGCSTQGLIDRGWELQHAVLEARLDAKSPGLVKVRGAIISSPFPSFPAYRTDLPAAVARRVAAQESKVSSRQPAGDDPSLHR